MFFCNDTAPTEIYTLSLHDALPILRGDCRRPSNGCVFAVQDGVSDFGDLSSPARWSGRGDPPGRLRAPHPLPTVVAVRPGDRKSTRLNSSHANISYAVFCLIKNIRT